MFTAQVYRIMIGCPGDVEEEVKIAKDVISRWTNLHAEQNSIVLLPSHWSTNSYPEQGAHPQTILNEQLAEKSDMLVGIFGSKIGTPTNKAKSGTIEEIEEHIKSGKPVMLFFRRYNDLSKTSPSNLAALDEFKNDIKARVLYGEYNTVSDFEKTFTDALELFLADNWLKVPRPHERKDTRISFSDEEIAAVKKWVESNNNTAFVLGDMGGKIYVLGNISYQVELGRDEAQWSDFFERLQRVGFVKYSRMTKQGPVYELQKSAFDYFDNIK